MTPHQDAETRRNKTEFTSSYALRDSGVTRVSELARCRWTACVIRCANAPVSTDSPDLQKKFATCHAVAAKRVGGSEIRNLRSEIRPPPRLRASLILQSIMLQQPIGYWFAPNATGHAMPAFLLFATVRIGE